jgi:hypothetical protein
MAWYAAHDIPVELNEPHHWGMRDAPDVVMVVVPSSAHAAIAAAAAPHLRDGQIVLLSLVPIAALGQHYGVSVRGMDSIIQLACIIHKTDYWRRGRTPTKLGLAQLSVSELTQYVNEGVRD